MLVYYNTDAQGTGLGAGGGKPSSAQVANITNCVLYGKLESIARLATGAEPDSILGVYTLVAFVAGSFVNVFGVRATLCIGAVGYPIYASGLWYVH